MIKPALSYLILFGGQGNLRVPIVSYQVSGVRNDWAAGKMMA